MLNGLLALLLKQSADKERTELEKKMMNARDILKESYIKGGFNRKQAETLMNMIDYFIHRIGEVEQKAIVPLSDAEMARRINEGRKWQERN